VGSMLISNFSGKNAAVLGETPPNAFRPWCRRHI
jgi:hypothetical protein